YGMVPVASRKVSRAPRYSGIGFEFSSFSPTWLSHSMAPLSRGLRLTTEMVHFPGFARARLWIHRAVRGFCPRGFPHSEIPGSKPACGSPRLIAACHVLHRLLLPRHPPCALSSLTTKFTQHTQISFQPSAISLPPKTNSNTPLKF